MTLRIDFTPQEEAWLQAQAQQQGIPPAEVIRKMVDERLPAQETSGAESLLCRPTGRAVDRLRERLAAENTDDPEQLRAAQQQLDELKRRMNEERQNAGTEPIF